MDLNQAWVYPIFILLLNFNLMWISGVYDLGLTNAIQPNALCWLPNDIKSGMIDSQGHIITDPNYWSVNNDALAQPNFAQTCTQRNVESIGGGFQQQLVNALQNIIGAALNIVVQIPLVKEFVTYTLFFVDMTEIVLNGWVRFLSNMGLPAFLIIPMTLLNYLFLVVGLIQIFGYVVITAKKFLGV